MIRLILAILILATMSSISPAQVTVTGSPSAADCTYFSSSTSITGTGNCTMNSSGDIFVQNNTAKGISTLGTGTGAAQNSNYAGSGNILNERNGTSASPVTQFYFANPDIYIGRNDATTNGSCPLTYVLIDPCLAPVVRLDMNNQNTGTMSTQNGILINGWGYRANTSSLNGQAAIGIGIALSDAATPNFVNLYGSNPNLTVNGVPSSGRGTANTPRVIDGMEVDLTNNAGVDGVWYGSNGNYIVGTSINSVGANNSTLGIQIDTVSGTSGKGWLTGEYIAACLNSCLSTFTSNSMKPTYQVHLAAGSTYGLVIGGGGILADETHNGGVTVGYPSTAGIALNSQGSSANANSNTIRYIGTNASAAAEYFDMYKAGGTDNQLRFAWGGTWQGGGFDNDGGISSQNVFRVRDNTNTTRGSFSISGTLTTLVTGVIESNGTQSVSGCSLTSAVGGASAGQFSSGTSGTCQVTITPGITASHGFSCQASDLSTPSVHMSQVSNTATACIISGTTNSGDVITWSAIAF
jgi:hypothetical protein